MAFVTIIVPERILYAPRFKTSASIRRCCHGIAVRSAINWTIIDGDARPASHGFGPTVNRYRPILIQRRVPIGQRIPPVAIFNSLFPLGIESMIEAVDQIAAALHQPRRKTKALRPMNHPAAMRMLRRFSQAREGGLQPRARCDPQRARLRLWPVAAYGFMTRCWKVEWCERGCTIISIDADGMRIALDCATMLVRRARFDSSPKEGRAGGTRCDNQITAGARLE